VVHCAVLARLGTRERHTEPSICSALGALADGAL
jgi:hypothetical protein